MTLTRALPTTAASAHRATSDTCSGREMPKPTATGSVVSARIRATSASAPDATVCRAPGDAQARDAVQEPAAEGRGPSNPFRRGRGAQEENCIKPGLVQPIPHVAGLLDRQIEREHAIHTSRGGARGELGNAHADDRVDVREEHDWARQSRPARWPRARARPRGCVPAASARSVARWMTGPSASGSENGTPTSSTSAPAPARATSTCLECSRSGSPAVTYVTSPGRPLARTPANALASRETRGVAPVLVTVTTVPRTRAPRSAGPCRRAPTGSPG